MTLIQLYQVVSAALKVGRFAYRQADNKVAQYAEQEGITKSEAWARVRAEAARRGDGSVASAADLILKGGPVSMIVLPNFYWAAKAYRAWRPRNYS